MSDVKNKFTYDSYVRMMKGFEESGYRIVRFKDVYRKQAKSPVVIARHDVDLSVMKAAEVAEIEHNVGIKATYFVMLSSDAYNLMSKKNAAALRRIQLCGHEIGLHFDSTAYDIKVPEQLEFCVSYELGILESIIGEKVKSVAWHTPTQQMFGKRFSFLEKEGIANAYDDEFVNGYKYCSDSNMYWRDEPQQYMDAEKYPKLQILTHPMWYSRYAVGSRETIRENALEEARVDAEDYLDSIVIL